MPRELAHPRDAEDHADRERFHGLIANIYRAAYSQDLWSQALTAWRGSLSMSSCYIASHALPVGKGKVVCASGMPVDFGQRYESIPWSQSGWLQRLRTEAGLGTVYRDSELFGANDTAGDTEFHDLMESVGLSHGLVAVLVATPFRLTYICMGRRPDEALPDERAVEDASLVVSHLAHALRMRQDFAGTGFSGLGSMTALDHLTYGAMIVDNRGRPVAMNETARKTLAERDGLVEEAGGIEFRVDNRWVSLRRFLKDWRQVNRERVQGCRARTLVVAREKTEHALTVSLYLPLPDEEDAFDSQGALLLIADPARPYRADTELLRQMFGLTRAEARLTSMIAAGHRLGEAAESLGITVGTARTHLKRIFSKTGAASQVELVLLATHCAPPTIDTIVEEQLLRA